jgi:hypothetical protein
MVDGHQAFVDKLESRIDKKTLSDWKTQSANRSGGTKVETKGKEVLISPESSDDPTAMSINRFAAETYPTAFAHQEEAKVLDSNLKKRT